MDWYNENEPFAAAWLRQLIADQLIPDGVVDERDIQDVQPGDLVGYRRCHFFAGIAGWAEAIEISGWGDEPLWTGSCPCQPFSQAGKGASAADPRHLWPTWFGLIRQCQPSVVFGEQIASVDGLAWLDLVYADLEGEGYAVGSADLPAAGVGAGHGRQRLYFVGDRGWADADRGHEHGRVVPVEVGRQRRQAEAHAVSFAPRNLWAVEPRPAALADGVQGRLGRLRGYGNSICPDVAGAFIAAYLEAR